MRKFLRAFRRAGLLLACLAWGAPNLEGAPSDGAPLGYIECTLRCNWEGYRIDVIVPGDAILPGRDTPTNARIIEVMKTRRLQYGNVGLVRGMFGTMYPPPQEAKVTLVKADSTVDDGLCNNEGLPLRGSVYEIRWRNDLPFEGGQTRLDSIGVAGCHMGLENLRQMYNTYAKPSVPIPRCRAFAQGCRPKPDIPDSEDETVIGPIGHVPAEFESAEDRDMAHTIRSTPVWTDWLNRDTPGGSGDFETLRDFRNRGLACDKPLAIRCQTVGGKKWQKTGDKYVCDPARGGICLNREQDDNRCENYRVRFLCERAGGEVTPR